MTRSSVTLCLAFSVLVLLIRVGAGQGPPTIALGMRLIVVESMTDAEAVRAQLARGRDFATLAREKSTDPTAVGGGYLGRLDPATLRPELREALQGVAVGEYTPIVRIPSGFAMLQLVPDSDAPRLEDDNPARILAATSTGAAKITLNVSGLTEADAVFLRFPKPDGWNQDLRAMCDARGRSTPMLLQRLEGTRLSEAGEPPLDVMQGQYAWAQLHAYLGDMDKAIARWQVASGIAQANVPGSRQAMLETLGIAYLHKAGLDNDVFRAPGDLCLFPPKLGAAYADTSASEKALQYFSTYLEQQSDDLEVKWLLNLAYTTVGKYPGGVPAKHLIPPSAFESKERIGRFVDVAPQAGLKVFSMAGGAIVDRFGADGLLDVVTSSMDVCEPLHFFRNGGDGTFTERTSEARLADQLGGLNLIQADYNNDSCLDFLVLRGGWEFPMRKSLLRNNCNGTFTDVTRESGLWNTTSSTQTAVWADVDNDGHLDLFAGSENGPGQLLRNTGRGTFEDISKAAGVDRATYAKAVVAADYDNDGYVDFYVSNYNGNNFLYHNEHDRTFTEVAKRAGVQAPWRSFAAWFFDYDNDGWPDLFVNSYYISNDESMRTYLGLPHNGETSKLYRNLGDGTFRDVSAAVGLDHAFMPMAANFGDADNDGYLDMYLGMGSPSFASVLPHELLLNKGGQSFVSVTAASGTGELHKGHGIAFADLDRDGDEDIVAQVGGAVPGDRHAMRLFENPGGANDWINVRLVGVKSNRSAIGARLTITTENAGNGGARSVRAIHRTVGSGGSFGANPLEQHVGLGRSARVRSVEVWWPASNTKQAFSNIAKNQFIEIRELAKDYSKLERRPVRLGRK